MHPHTHKQNEYILTFRITHIYAYTSYRLMYYACVPTFRNNINNTHTCRAERCLGEFFAQGAKEKELGLPISPQCNPETTSLPSSQIGFIKFIVLPSYQVLGMLLPEVEDICVKQLNSNMEYWQEEASKLKHAADKKEAIGQRNIELIKHVPFTEACVDGNPKKSDHSGPITIGRKSTSSRVISFVPQTKRWARRYSLQATSEVDGHLHVEK
jgi:hypothetical protein